jgi:hypothetical protein
MTKQQYPMNHQWLWAGIFVLGLACGKLVHMAANPRTAGGSTVPEASATKSARQHPQTSLSYRHFWQETAALRDDDMFPVEVRRIYRESRSPLRAVSLLSFRIQNSTFEEWEGLLAAGKITETKFLGELGEHLARTDSRRALRFVFNGPFRFDNLDQVYAFRDPMLRTVADTDPMLLLEELKALKRGGVQMDSSLFFSRYWAEKDPRAAAEHFTDLVKLRNMTMEGSTEMPDGAFAEIIMRSWLGKAPDEASEYVSALPEGAQRKALTEAMQKILLP